MSLRNSACYGAGAYGMNLVYSFMTMYLMYYLTETIHISPVFVGLLFLVVRLIDALLTPVIGIMVDATSTRLGRFKPWILAGTVANGLAMVLLFYVMPTAVSHRPEPLVSVLYALWCLTYALEDIPFWAMIPALDEGKGIDGITVVVRLCAASGSFLVIVAALPLVKLFGAGSAVVGYLDLAVALAVVSIFTCAIMVAGIKENRRYEPRRYRLRDLADILAKNDRALIVSLILLLFSLALTLTSNMWIYYFKYVFGDASKYIEYIIVTGIFQALSMLSFPAMDKAIGKRRTFLLSVLVALIGYVILATVGTMGIRSMAIVYFAGSLISIAIGFSQVLGTILLADTVAYGEEKTGSRNEGFILSLQPFIAKASSAFSSLIMGFGLAYAGVSGQPAGFSGPRLSVAMFGIPIIACILSGLIFQNWGPRSGQDRDVAARGIGDPPFSDGR